jgi:hypothetical protein
VIRRKIVRTKKADEPKKIKLPAGAQARSLIEEQMAAFLNGGGKVNQIPKGVTGQREGPMKQPAVAAKKPAKAKE